jgi:hypothetical protein
MRWLLKSVSILGALITSAIKQAALTTSTVPITKIYISVSYSKWMLVISTGRNARVFDYSVQLNHSIYTLRGTKGAIRQENNYFSSMPSHLVTKAAISSLG